jgi:hypothetical protein
MKTDANEVARFKRHAQMRYLGRKLKPYTQGAAPIRMQQRQDYDAGQYARLIGHGLSDVLQLQVGNCTYLSGLQPNAVTRFRPNVDEVAGGSTCPIGLTGIPGTQIGVEVNLYDVAKAWRYDETDIAHADTELRVDLPPAPCDGFYFWFTVVHLCASTWFGDVDSGASDVSFGYRADLAPVAPNAPFAIPALTPYMQFDGPDAELAPVHAVEVDGTGTWGTSFDVSQVLPVRAGDAPVLRFYTRGVASALVGRCNLKFGSGVFDPWAVRSGSGFNDTVRGVRYLTFPPSGLTAAPSVW